MNTSSPKPLPLNSADFNHHHFEKSRFSMSVSSNRHRNFVRAICLAWCLVGVAVSASDQIPGAKQKTPILIRNATVHTVTQGTLPNTSVLLRDGKIAEIGANIQSVDGYEVIDAAGQHVYPGLIDSFSAVGLVEIDSIRASIDNSEMGTINPNDSRGTRQRSFVFLGWSNRRAHLRTRVGPANGRMDVGGHDAPSRCRHDGQLAAFR
jgi:hypothetical protein